MALNAVGVKCNEDQVNDVIGAKPMQGARWEEVLACAQYFGCRATLTTPATLTQVKQWTDQGKPVLIAWNPEGRDWSHASLIFDVTGEKGNFVVHVADPNIPNPDKTTREVSEDDFYAKWYEKWPNYLVRRPALMIEREICEDGRQIMASKKKKKDDPSMPKYRDPNAQGMFDGTGVGSSGKGKHKNREKDLAKGRSRKRKHKKDLRREMRYAGLMKPPAMLTNDVYTHIISQASANYVQALNRKLREFKKYRETEAVRYEPLLTAIDEIREAADSKGTREIYSRYKHFAEMSRGFFGYGYISDFKMKAFSGVKSSERREAVKALVEDQIEKNLEAMEGRLAYGERMIPNVKEKVKGFRALNTLKLKPMKKDERKFVQFPIYLDEWYVDQRSLEEHREMVSQAKREALTRYRARVEDRLERATSDTRRNFLEEEIEEIIERADNLENEIENLPHINLRIEVSKEHPHWQAGYNHFFMPLADAQAVVDSPGLLPDPRSIANNIHRIVVHEMTHAGQTILSYIALKINDFFDLAGRREAGLPSRKIRTPQFQQDQGGAVTPSSLDRHNLDDVEFYTDLTDAIRVMMPRIKRLEDDGLLKSVQDKNLAFKRLVGQKLSREELREDWLYYVRPIPFFMALKNNATPKYEKAVGEAYKLVFKSFAHQRMAKRLVGKYLKGI